MWSVMRAPCGGRLGGGTEEGAGMAAASSRVRRRLKRFCSEDLEREVRPLASTMRSQLPGCFETASTRRLSSSGENMPRRFSALLECEPPES